MKKQALFIGFIAVISLVNSTSEDMSVEGSAKQKVNFYGSIQTWQGKNYKVDNIAIGRKFKQIVFFEMPGSQETVHATHEIKKNPKDGIITRIDLAEICEIRAPQPDVTWKYVHNKDREIEYIQVDIISHDGSIDSYLVETNRKITADVKKKGAPTEKVFPFACIRRLMIKGYTLRESKEQKELEEATKECPSEEDIVAPKASGPVALPES